MTRREWIALTGFAAQGQWAAAERLLLAATAQEKPRAAVLAVEDNAQQWQKAFGQARADSRFLIASITKPMTAVGVMTLVDRGQLRLDEDIVRYLPERPGILLRHLLTHTSGLPDMLPENTALRQRNAPLEEYVRLALRTPLLFAPGTKWSYSSTGILLAAEIARRLDGRPFAELLRQEVFQPWGMRQTVLGKPAGPWVRSQTDFAPADLGGAASDTARWDWNSEYWRALGVPWGGAHSTAADILRLLGEFLRPSGRVLRPDTAANMIRNQNPAGMEPYALGWRVGGKLGRGLSEETFGHAGSTGTLCWADPRKKRAFVLLTSLPDAVARQAIIAPVSEAVAAR